MKIYTKITEDVLIKMWCLKCGNVTKHNYCVDPVERILESQCQKCETAYKWTPREY